MGVFSKNRSEVQFNDGSEQEGLCLEDEDVEMISVTDHVVAEHKNLRNTIPKAICEEVGISEEDHLLIKPTENGFVAEGLKSDS